VIRTLYSFVTWVLQPLVRKKIRLRAVLEPGYGENIEERFGVYSPHTADRSRPLIWMHTVSLGETRAAAILLKKLRILIPNMRLLLTNGTATGRAEGVKLLQNGDVQVWQPWDTQDATQQFFKHFQPCIGVLLETEIWPNLIGNARAAHLPVLLVNARMSEKSLKKTRHLKWLAKNVYRDLAQIYVQTEDDAARLTLIGAKVDGVFGNLKFDITPDPDQLMQAQAMQNALSKPVILFASSREGEERIFLNALRALSDKTRASVHWLIVPRHPQRFDEVANLILAAGFSISRRGRWPIDALDDSIWLGDSLGEMTFYCGLASAELLGGSFEKLGGQNLIEVLACGCPVVMGPHTFNFDEAAAHAAQANVAFRVETLEDAVECSLALCFTQSFARGDACHFVAGHRGAAEKTAKAIQSSLLRQQCINRHEIRFF
jgi:3-deoxy-D-manno-octulosonic-acid transferase